MQNPFDQFDHPKVSTLPITGPKAPPPKTATEQAIDEERLQGERLRNKQLAEQESGTIDIPGDRTKTGDDYLKTLSPADASIVQAMAEGRSSIPAGYSMRSQRAQQLLAATAQYDPTFDAANLPSRIATRKAFTSGKQAQNIISFNTALGHLQRLAQSSEQLGNFEHIPLLNSAVNGVKNFVADKSGYPEVGNFNTDRQAVADELTRAFRGTGGNVSDITDWENKINTAKSPEQLRGVITEAAKLLQSRIESVQQAYNAGMGTTDKPLPMLYPHAMDAIQALQSDDYKNKGYTAVAPLFPGGNGGDTGGTGGKPGGNDPIDPAGTGYIGAQGAPPHQGDVVAVPPESLKQFQSFMGTLRPGSVPDAQLADTLSQKWQELAGRPLTNAADLAHTFNTSGQIAGAVNYQPVGDLKAKMDKEAADQKLISSQDISANRGGGGTGETLDAGVRGVSNAASFGLADKAAAGISSLFGSGSYNQNLAHEKAIDQYDSQNHGIAQLVGSSLGVLGNESAVAKLGDIPALGGVVSRIPQGARPALADALYGGVSGAVGSDDNRVGSALTGALTAGAAGMAGRGVTRLGAAALAPVAAPVVQRLTDAGITLTPGQIMGASKGMLGRFAKGTEDKLTSNFGLGDFIANARRGGINDFNRAAANDALSVLNPESPATLPPDVQPGHGLIQHLQDAREQAYDTALQPLRAYRDDQLVSDIQDVAQGVRPDQADAFAKSMRELVAPHLPTGDAPLTGTQLQSIKRGLNDKIYPLKQDPNGSDLAGDLGDIRDAFMSFAQRSDPANTAAYQRADAFHSLLSRIEDAAAKTKDGVFTPQQFRTAIGRRGYGTTTSNLASGNAPFQELATDASTVLPSSIPDSGTAGRLSVLSALAPSALGASIGGAGGYADDGRNEALTGAALGAMLFSKPGLKATQWALAGSRGRKLDTLGSFLRDGGATPPVSVGGSTVIPSINVVPPELIGAAAVPAALGAYQGGQ